MVLSVNLHSLSNFLEAHNHFETHGDNNTIHTDRLASHHGERG